MRLESTTQQPKILRRMVYRFAILALVITGIVAAYIKIKQLGSDIDLPLTYNTQGMIAAIELLDDGSQAVVFLPDGTKLPSPKYSAGKLDKDPAWRPDGNRLFFLSNRDEDAVNIYRWNFGSKDLARRTINSRTKGATQWLPPNATDANKSALITAGPVVVEFDPSEGSTRQILPPVMKDRVRGEEGGSAGQFDQMYNQLGSSFKSAKWTSDKKFVVAIMRNDVGEVLIAQNLQTGEPPVPIAAGERIEFDIHPTSNQIFYAVLAFELINRDEAPPELVQPDGSIKLPFRHVIGAFNLEIDPKTANTVIALSKVDENAFQNLSISPDGTTLMVIDGAYLGGNNFKPRGIVVMPAQEGGGNTGTMLVKGEVYEPSWLPGSDGILFIQYDEQKKRSIFKLSRSGGTPENISKGSGDFSHPKMSPQVAN